MTFILNDIKRDDFLKGLEVLGTDKKWFLYLYKLKVMNKSNYDLVLEVIENYDSEDILNNFKNEFEEGSNISESDYFWFCENYIMDDLSEMIYIKLNWKYIKSGGDESVYDEDNDDWNDEDDKFKNEYFLKHLLVRNYQRRSKE